MEGYETNIMGIYDSLRKIAFSRERNFERAEDLIHDTVEYLLKNKNKYHNHPNLEALGIMKLKNLQIDSFRKSKRDNFTEIKEDIPDTHNLNLDDEKILKLNQAHKALDQVSKDCRELIKLSIFGKTYKEISSILEIKIGTVMSRLSRCFDHLRGHVL